MIYDKKIILECIRINKSLIKTNCTYRICPICLKKYFEHYQMKDLFNSVAILKDAYGFCDFICFAIFREIMQIDYDENAET